MNDKKWLIGFILLFGGFYATAKTAVSNFIANLTFGFAGISAFNLGNAIKFDYSMSVKNANTQAVTVNNFVGQMLYNGLKVADIIYSTPVTVLPGTTTILKFDVTVNFEDLANEIINFIVTGFKFSEKAHINGNISVTYAGVTLPSSINQDVSIV